MKTKFERVSLLPPYVFSEINNLKAKERLKGRDIIDLGMGNPDSPTPKHIVNKMISTIKNLYMRGINTAVLGCGRHSISHLHTKGICSSLDTVWYR